MKKIPKIIITAAVISTMSVPAIAAEIPLESAPLNASIQSVEITENLIAPILSEVENGLGFADAQAKAQNIIFNAVLAGQTQGYGYADLTAIARNSIFQYRDMYLRPEFYKEAEETTRVIIADLITAIENDTLDYETARKQAYIKIMKWVRPSFSEEDMQGDFCYWDIPSVDSTYFNRARKLLIEAQTRRNTQ